jgi:prolyl 4-hydroxylase
MAAEIPLQWRNWLQENLVRGVAPEQLVATMQENHFELTQINYALIEMIREIENRLEPQNTFIPPDPCDGLGKPWSVVLQLRRPVIQVYKNVLSSDECDELVGMSRHKLRPSTTVDKETGEMKAHEHRTSHGTFFQRGENELIRLMETRASEIMNLPIEHGEGIQVLRYDVGGEYRPHFDYFPSEHKGSQVHIKQGGQRAATLIFYLNDVEEGGETVFPEVSLKVAPLKGTAVYFSYFSQGMVNPLSLHGGMPVIKGEKWIATKWMREKPY